MAKAYFSNENRFNLLSDYDICDNKTNKNIDSRISASHFQDSVDREFNEICLSSIIKASSHLTSKKVNSDNSNYFKAFADAMKEKISPRLNE